MTLTAIHFVSFFVYRLYNFSSTFTPDKTQLYILISNKIQTYGLCWLKLQVTVPAIGSVYSLWARPSQCDKWQWQCFRYVLVYIIHNVAQSPCYIVLHWLISKIRCLEMLVVKNKLIMNMGIPSYGTVKIWAKLPLSKLYSTRSRCIRLDTSTNSSRIRIYGILTWQTGEQNSFGYLNTTNA